MKTIGIIGGLGPASTLKYYEWLTAGVQKAPGGHHGARIVLTSVDGKDIAAFRRIADEESEGQFFADEARRLERAGADFILIASNTSHKNAPYVEAAVSIPLLHLADVTARRIAAAGLRRIALLGTAATMERDFYKARLRAEGVEVVIPDDEDRAFVNEAIYRRLVRNIVTGEDRAAFVSIVDRTAGRGVEGVILGCTELTLLDIDDRVTIPVFDTVRLHVEAALELALA